MSERNMFIVAILVIIALLGIIVGPVAWDRKLSSWKAGAYGSDWIVVQYAQDGSVINIWKLRGKSVGNERNSDGIFFTDHAHAPSFWPAKSHAAIAELSDFETGSAKCLFDHVLPICAMGLVCV